MKVFPLAFFSQKKMPFGHGIVGLSFNVTFFLEALSGSIMALAAGHISKYSAKETQPHKSVLSICEHIDHSKEPQLPCNFPRIRFLSSKRWKPDFVLFCSLSHQGTVEYKTLPEKFWEILLYLYNSDIKILSLLPSILG